MNLDLANRLRITCAPGLAPYLERELLAMGLTPESIEQTHVDTSGTMRDVMRLNLHLRTALSVQWLLREFACDGPEALYDEIRSVEWEEIIPVDGYFSVVSRANHPSITNWTYANLKVKDAIVDRIADKFGSRPDSGPERNRIVVNLHWHGDRASIYLNTSGEKLADRGYRRRPFLAPMQETLAAGVVMATGYTGEQAMVNPMCGSGTLAIEAALIAMGRAPGLLRANFGMRHIKDFDDEAWQAARREAQKARKKSPPARIVATDRDPKAIEAAIANAKTAGVDHAIEFGVCDFAESPIPEGGGIVLINPEYGERMGEIDALTETYGRIGDFFKQKCAGYTGYIFTGNLDLAKKVGLHASRRIVFFNAKIECRLLKYEMYSGTRRKQES